MYEILNNTSVAIIGNSESLFKYNFGPEINSHDVIIRINKSASLCFETKYRNIYRTHGTKTTIWAFSFADTMKSIINKNHTKAKYLLQMNDYTKNKIQHQFNFDAISSSDISELKEKLNRHGDKTNTNYGPSTGLRVLDFVSKHNPQSVTVYGFDWKETPTFYDFKRATRFTETRHNHNYQFEMNYCKEVFKSKFGFNFKGVSL